MNPHNKLPETSKKCNSCGECRVDNLEIEVAINSIPCTVYEIVCKTCSKTGYVEVARDVVNDADIKLKDTTYTVVRSALTGRIIDRKSRAAGEKE